MGAFGNGDEGRGRGDPHYGCAGSGPYGAFRRSGAGYRPAEQDRGKSIVVTGHNLYALEELLKQTEGKGINIYTHSEMLPAHGYPALKKYPHLKGNIGKAWYDQRRLFDQYSGAILATTNCVMPIKGIYADRFFSYDVAGLEGVTKIVNDDFSPLIERALALPAADVESDQTLTTGYHHETVLGLAPEIIQAVYDQGFLRALIKQQSTRLLMIKSSELNQIFIKVPVIHTGTFFVTCNRNVHVTKFLIRQ